MPHCRRVLTCLALAAWGIFAALLPLFSHATPPALLLAQVYRPGMALHGYWVSEKYDGVRGYWDGQRLRTRGGEVPPRIKLMTCLSFGSLTPAFVSSFAVSPVSARATSTQSVDKN